MRGWRSGAAGVVSLWMAPLACGGGDLTTSRTIGREGGSVAQGGAEVVVPQGAVSGDVEISITTTSDPAPDGWSADSPIYRFEPSGLVFEEPARVRIGSDRRDLSIVWSETSGEGFALLSSSVESGVVTAAIDHFSLGFVGMQSCETDADGDGYLDCEDCDDQAPDSHPGAIESCGDGLDNDCDLAPDCGDDDCAGASCGGGLFCVAGVCTDRPPEPECSDTVDNDGDGAIDAEDPQCSGPLDNDEGVFSG